MEKDITAKEKLLQLLGEMHATDPTTEFDSARCLNAVQNFAHETRVLAQCAERKRLDGEASQDVAAWMDSCHEEREGTDIERRALMDAQERIKKLEAVADAVIKYRNTPQLDERKKT